MSIWVGGIVTQDMIESLTPYCPRPVSIARTTWWAKFSGTFRTQTYWLLATRGAWRVCGRWRTGRFEPAKTDRVLAATGPPGRVPPGASTALTPRRPALNAVR